LALRGKKLKHTLGMLLNRNAKIPNLLIILY